MSTYVDDPESFIGSEKFCHLTADTRDELLKMANRLNLFAVDMENMDIPGMEYFVLPRGKRITAIKLGAIPK